MSKKFDVRLVMGRVGFGLVSQGESPWTRYVFDILVGKEDGREKVAGHLEASKLSLGEMYRQRTPLWMVFEDYSAAATNCHAAVFTAKGDIRKAFWDCQYGQEEVLLNDFHHLERIEIKEEFKGCGLAGVATQIYLENFANGNDVAYLKAFSPPIRSTERSIQKEVRRVGEGVSEEVVRVLRAAGVSQDWKEPALFLCRRPVFGKAEGDGGGMRRNGEREGFAVRGEARDGEARDG